ncbi:hypothetical protein WH52_03800 [Tenacibaculum holothuriorum]|uniref:Uncharacterized protein n=1 Tax=Tenacibaculum holothuriorum TaxID=1635173 RepID=A0A1Y2PFK6_9FLAO|nr:hypothetical protein [Tenacibaculum holothuriorum]OSY88801.1 hypothetical protein WH52_03800 [Tenacibaculum holothuriorum]
MNKPLFTYFLAFVLLASVAVPSYISITEEVCETSLVLDIEDENDSENSKEAEFKIVPLSFEFSSTYTLAFGFQKNIYKSTQYDSIYRKLESPPPEFS